MANKPAPKPASKPKLVVKKSVVCHDVKIKPLPGYPIHLYNIPK